MTGHPNAPLTPAGRRRLCKRVDAGRPISHVAAEAGISRRCLAKWYARYRTDGEDGLHDRSSRPDASPTRTADDVADLVEALRRQSKYGAARLAADLARLHGVAIAPSTVHRILVRRGISNLRDLDPPTGLQMREVVRYEHEHLGDMIHVDIKKLGRIPDGGGWHSHGRDSDAARASKRKGAGTGRVGYVYLHSAVDDHSRLAYTESLPDEKAVTVVAFWHRAVAFFAAHGITRIVRCLTDNGSCYRSHEWARALAATGTHHKKTRPYTPRTNGKVERYNGTLAREWAYVRPYASEAERTAALADFLNYYNLDRPHSAIGHRPPVSRASGSGLRVNVQPEPLAEVPENERLGQTTLFDV
jgi:transposase InsO family protein